MSRLEENGLDMSGRMTLLHPKLILGGRMMLGVLSTISRQGGLKKPTTATQPVLFTSSVRSRTGHGSLLPLGNPAIRMKAHSTIARTINRVARSRSLRRVANVIRVVKRKIDEKMIVI
jgi:hypothetical protein